MEENWLIHSNELHLIETSEIHKAVEKMIDRLGIAAGSTNGFDLYKVIETYFKDLDKRHQINKLLKIPDKNTYHAEEIIEEEIIKNEING